MRDHVLFYLNGRREIVRGERVFQPLSDYLRYARSLVGTKVVCAEGDCGSCCVLLGKPEGDRLVYRNVTSCIQYVFQLDGVHVVTIEGLRPNGQLTAVQESMIACQGAQCGFCTPGFVVSMHAMLEDRPRLNDADLRLGLSGNLCRCTGYEAILKAGCEADLSRHQRLDDLYPPGVTGAECKSAIREPVRINAGDRTFFKPTSLAEATTFKAKHPDCLVIAGGTDLGVVMNKGKLSPRVVMSVAALPLDGVVVSGESIMVGAMVTLAEFEIACRDTLPEMSRLMLRHGSPPIRNAGTVAGNIANGSPIGDTMPGLFVLNAEVKLTGVGGSRRVNLNDFYTGYRQTVMKQDELITAVHIPLPSTGDVFRLYKISKRHDLDISTFSAAFWMRTDGNTITNVRIAYGGVGPIIQRMRQAEAALIGRSISEDLIDQAAEAATGEIQPISDVRGGKDYRLTLAANLVRKFFAETFAAEQTSGNGRAH